MLPGAFFHLAQPDIMQRDALHVALALDEIGLLGARVLDREIVPDHQVMALPAVHIDMVGRVEMREQLGNQPVALQFVEPMNTARVKLGRNRVGLPVLGWTRRSG
jgi:hypothetical protein